MPSAISSLFSDFPDLDGDVSCQMLDLQNVSSDFGQIVHTKPMIVVRPKTSADIAKVVRFAIDKNLNIIPRGMAHCAYGQSQCDGGIVFDMTRFNAILAADFSVEKPWMDAQSGATWDKLIKFSGSAGFAPPTTTDWQLVTMGGTLSTGGVGFMSYLYGLQTDNVLELDVIDGQGELHTCSPMQKPDLFDAVRAGLGQYGIITRARILLSPMPQKMHVYQLFFTSLVKFSAAMQNITNQGYFECVHAFVIPNQEHAIKTRLATLATKADPQAVQSYCDALQTTATKWLFFVELVKYDEQNAQETAAQINALQVFAERTFSAIEPFYDYVTKEPPLIAVEKRKGKTPHPELAVIQPSTSFETFMERSLADLSPDDMGEGPLLIIPVLSKPVTTPMFIRPSSELFYFIGFLRNAFPATAERIAELTRQNLSLYQQSCDAGGNRYPCDSIPQPADPAGWQLHYGQSRWPQLQSAKAKYDPHKLFVSNLNMF